LAVLLASAVFHAVLLIALVRYLPPPPTYVEGPSLEVSLIAPPRPNRARRAVARRARPDDRGALIRTAPTPSIPSVSPSSSEGGATPPAPGGDAPGDGATPRRPVLRGLRGCDLATREERERCEAERWARAAPIAPRLNLDPSGRYAKNPEPFLLRRPKDGCRARMGGDVDVRGDDSNVRAGVTCVVPF
jgi:hypothetical protein